MNLLKLFKRKQKTVSLTVTDFESSVGLSAENFKGEYQWYWQIQEDNRISVLHKRVPADRVLRENEFPAYTKEQISNHEINSFITLNVRKELYDKR